MSLKSRKEKVLDKCGCVCYCPNCRDILNDQADCEDDTEAQKVYYHCNSCGHDSIWTFDAFPIPVLLNASQQ